MDVEDEEEAEEDFEPEDSRRKDQKDIFEICSFTGIQMGN